MTILFWVGLNNAIHRYKQPFLHHSAVDKSLSITGCLYINSEHSPSTFNLPAHNVLMLCFLLHAAIFSAGNTSSISSFSLESVCRFITTFSPTAQGGLLGLKLLMPLLIVLMMIRLISNSLGLPHGILFMMITGLLDLVILRFFLTFKSTSDWHVVGAGINRFLLANILLVGASVLEFTMCL
jgi:phosphatidylinositol glycan class N